MPIIVCTKLARRSDLLVLRDALCANEAKLRRLTGGKQVDLWLNWTGPHESNNPENSCVGVIWAAQEREWKLKEKVEAILKGLCKNDQRFEFADQGDTEHIVMPERHEA